MRSMVIGLVLINFERYVRVTRLTFLRSPIGSILVYKSVSQMDRF